MLLIVVLPILFVLIVVPIVTLLYGITRWQSATGQMLQRLDATRAQLSARTFDPDEVRDLPVPVRRYFEAVLHPGQPLVAVAEIGHRGKMNLDDAHEHWTPFSANQVVNTQSPGFAWDARIRKAPGIQVFVHDAYIAGKGILKAALFGLLKLADEEDSPKLAQAELMRFLAEAVWYPSKLLPSQGVQWEAIDETSALATLRDGDTAISLTFHFDESGMIRSVQAAGRCRVVKDDLEETPWEGRFWGYEVRSGMRIPIHGEAAWLLPDGRLPYWRGEVTDVLYKFAA